MLVVLSALGGWLSACGQSDAGSKSGGDGTSGSSGTAGSAGAPGGAGNGGAGGVAGSPGDFEVISGCASGSCTRQSSAQLIEAFSQYIDRDALACVLTALRDRSLGRYTHGTDSTFTSGSVGAHHTIVVLPDGAALYARRRYSSGTVVVTYEPEPAERCVLQPTSYFDACLTALERSSGTMDPEAWSCAFGSGGVTTPSTLHWFESCETESPPICPSR
jgi:hypothetical protein